MQPADRPSQNDVDHPCRFRECELRRDVFVQPAESNVPLARDQRRPAAVAGDGDQIAAFPAVVGPVVVPADPIAASGAVFAVAADVAPGDSIAASGAAFAAFVVAVFAGSVAADVAPGDSTAASGAAFAAFVVAASAEPASAFAAFAAEPAASFGAAVAAFVAELVVAFAAELVAVAAVGRRHACRPRRRGLCLERQCHLHRRLKALESRKK